MATKFTIGTKKGRQELKDFVFGIIHTANKAMQVEAAKSVPKKQLAEAYGLLKDAYYAGVPVVTDEEFNKYETVILTVDKKLYQVGSQSNELNKTSLPFGMGSMNKYLDEKSIQRWAVANPGPYVLSDKLDGISIGIKGTANPKKPGLYTRGDGNQGLDISHVAPYLDLPPIPNGWQGRGELIMPVATFEQFKDDFANPRNLVAGAANSKIIPPVFKGKKIKVVMYQIVKPAMDVDKQFAKLKAMGFLIPTVKKVLRLDINELTTYLLDRRKKSIYEMDGVIVSTTKVGRIPSSAGNPDYQFAFKSALMSEVATATVELVQWNESRYGTLKPRVKITPVRLAGVKVTWATGHNAKFIKDNKIGKGAVITLVRSGDVIPYITGVVTPARKADLPKAGSYDWDENSVNIRTIGSGEQQLTKSMTFFFVTLGLEGFKEATFDAMLEYMDVGGVQGLIRKVTKTPIRFAKELVEQAGFGAPTAKKFVAALADCIVDADLADLMVASGAFGHGMGLTLLKPAALSLGDPAGLQRTRAAREALREKLAELDGFGPKRADQFIAALPAFMTAFMAYTKAGLTYVLPKPPKKVRVASQLFKGQRFYLTGVRDSKVNEFIVKNGGVIGPFSANLTTTLIYKDGASNSKVNSFGGDKTPYSAFIEKYGIN
ncbi:NAD-dependent DNA ligase [Pseudomonas phage vB_PpuM-Peetri]